MSPATPGGGRRLSQQTPTLHPPTQLSSSPPKYLKRGRCESLDAAPELPRLNQPVTSRVSRRVRRRAADSQPVDAYLIKCTPASRPHRSTHPIFCILEAHILHHNDRWRNLATRWEIKRQCLERGDGAYQVRLCPIRHTAGH